MGGSGNGYHCNSLLYHASDDTYTIGDRNPSSFVKVSRAVDPPPLLSSVSPDGCPNPDSR